MRNEGWLRWHFLRLSNNAGQENNRNETQTQKTREIKTAGFPFGPLKNMQRFSVLSVNTTVFSARVACLHGWSHQNGTNTSRCTLVANTKVGRPDAWLTRWVPPSGRWLAVLCITDCWAWAVSAAAPWRRWRGACTYVCLQFDCEMLLPTLSNI